MAVRAACNIDSILKNQCSLTTSESSAVDNFSCLWLTSEKVQPKHFERGPYEHIFAAAKCFLALVMLNSLKNLWKFMTT